MAKTLRYVLALVKTVVEGVTIEGDAIVASAGPHRRGQLRCPICGRRCECHDHEPTRRRGAMDLARPECFPEYGPARVTCPEHGVRVERVPWARHGSRYTRDFEDWVACLAVRCRMSAVSRIARAGWHSVGGICGRACDEIEAQRGVGRFDGPGRIGIDETSHEKGHKYLTVVVDHDRGCLVWAHEGYGKEVLGLFLDEPAREQRRAIEVVTADGAKWTEALAGRRCPNARWVTGPFHVVEWTSDALDEVRREEWRVAKRAAQDAMPRRDGPGRPRRGEETPPEARALREAADAIKGSRYALVRNPEDLTGSQRAKLAELRRAGGRLFTAWDLKEDLRAVFRAGTADEAEAMPGGRPRGAACREIGPVVAVEKKAGRRRADVVAAVAPGAGVGRAGGTDDKAKVTVRMGHGSHDTDNLVALLMLRCSDGQPALPWEDRGEERRKADERRRRDRERDRKRRRGKVARGN